MGEKNKIQGIVYSINELSTNKIIYVGSTNNLKLRINNHLYFCYTLKKEYPIYKHLRAIAVTKDDFYRYFEFKILYTDNCKSIKELHEIEQQFLCKYNETILNAQKAFRSEQERLEYHKKYMNKYYYENEDYRKKL